MSYDAYSVCQHCFEATPGVYSLDGLTYCEDCFPLVTASREARRDANASDSSQPAIDATSLPKKRAVTPMSLRSSPLPKGLNHSFAPPAIPLPHYSPRTPESDRLWDKPRIKRRVALSYDDVKVLHRGSVLHFSGAEIGNAVHDGLNALWVGQGDIPPGKYTWVGAYRRPQGDFIVASRISRSDGPGDGVAFRFTRERLVAFLHKALVTASADEARIWKWIRNSWTLDE